MTDKEFITKGTEIIEKLLDLLKIESKAEVSLESDEEDQKILNIEIEGDDLGKLIGYRGNTLSALQLLVSQMIWGQVERQENMAILVDVNGYQKKRVKYLESLAFRAVKEAKENNQNVELPPLSAFERRIIHMALKKEDGVETESIGEGQDRHIVIKITK